MNFDGFQIAKDLTSDEITELFDSIKNFLRIDFFEDDNLIKDLIISAELYLKNAGCLVDYKNRLFTIALKMLVGHWYENREVVGTDGKMAYSLSSIIMQLQYCYESVVIV